MTTHDNAQPKPDTAGSVLPPQPSYAIAPEDQTLADQLSNFDPVADTPSPVTRKGGTSEPITELSLSMLPPDARMEIKAKLADVPMSRSKEVENKLIGEYLRNKALEVRIKSGLGEGATASQREAFKMAAERANYEREIVRAHEQLAQVERWVPVIDEVTGKQIVNRETGQPEVQAIELIKGDQRRGLEQRIAEMQYRIGLLDGHEGDHRRQKALFEDVEATKARLRELEIEREARSKADDMLKQELIDKRAEAYAKSRRYSL